jgi:hypothetical protein
MTTGARFYFLPDLKERRICNNHMGPRRLPGFPKPVKIGVRRNAWIADEVDAWVAERIAASRAAPPLAPAPSDAPAEKARARAFNQRIAERDKAVA